MIHLIKVIFTPCFTAITLKHRDSLLQCTYCFAHTRLYRFTISFDCSEGMTTRTTTPVVPFKDDAWSIARDRYTEDLTEEEKQAFDTATLETIYYDANVTEKTHRAGSSSRALFEAKIKPFLSAIEQYGEALDIYSNSYSLILCPLWGSIRVVLQIAREFGKYFDRLVDMFKCIGHILPRFRSYERLYSSHIGLLQALSIVYVDILKFCSEAKGVFRQAKHFSVINFKIVIKLFWKPFSQQFGQVIADFHQHRKNVEKEAGLAHMIESAGAREVELMERLELERQKRGQYRTNYNSSFC